MKTILKLFAMTAVVAVTTLAVYADIPPPKAVDPQIDWSFVLMGAIAAFLGALLFLWLGRKLFKRS